MAAKKSNRHWAGFDLGGTKMRVAVFNGDFEMVASAETRTKGFKGVRYGVQRMAELLDKAWDAVRKDAPRARLAGVGLACPGPVNAVTGIVREMPNVGWSTVRLGALLARATGVPVTVINDVDAGTYGEYRFGAGQGSHGAGLRAPDQARPDRAGASRHGQRVLLGLRRAAGLAIGAVHCLWRGLGRRRR